MKKLLIILLPLLVCMAISNVEAQDTTIIFSRVKTVDSMNSADIYKKVKLWSVGAFKNTAGALQLDDKESGLLAYDASTSAISPNAPVVSNTKAPWKLLPFYHQYTFKFQIQIKDSKYKIDVTDINYINGSDKYLMTSSVKAPYKYTFSNQSKADKEWADVKITCEDFVGKLIASLDTSINKKDAW